MIDKLLEYTPFVLTVGDCGTKKHKPNITRLIEVCVIAGILLYAFKGDVANIKESVSKIEKHVATLDDRLYEHMNKIR